MQPMLWVFCFYNVTGMHKGQRLQYPLLANARSILRKTFEVRARALHALDRRD